MQLNKIQDQRAPLFRLTRKELEYLARKEGRNDVVPGMPADLMRQQFIARPPSSFPRPMRGHLGSLKQLRIPKYEDWLKVAFSNAPIPEPQEQKVEEVNTADDLRRQWEAQQAPMPMTITEARQECKRRGIKIARTDKLVDLREKLNGQDTSQLRQ